MVWPFTRKAEAFERKASDFSTFRPFTGAAGMGTNPEAFAREGYLANAVIAACVKLIASASASVDLQIVKGKNGKVLSSHPMLDLMTRPNAMLSDHEYIEAAVSHFLIFGDAYVTRLPSAGVGGKSVTQPSELWLLQPQHMSVSAPQGYGLPVEYKYSPGGDRNQIFKVNQLTGYCDVLHVRNFNPVTLQRGLSPMEPAARSVDTHNAALRWNKALLDNSARPSGAITTPVGTDGKGTVLSPEEFARLRMIIDEQFTGVANSGRPFLLEGGLQWKEMSLSPKEMDFLSAVWAAAMHICMAYGVPPQMLGIPGSQTRANFEQADLTFWQGTILPTLNRVLSAHNRWLAPMFGDPTLRLVPDLNSIPALEPQRQMLYTRVNGNEVLTLDERRSMIGFGPLTEDQKEELLVSAQQVPFALMSAQLDAAEETLPGGEGGDPVDDEETDPPSDEDEVDNPSETDNEV